MICILIIGNFGAETFFVFLGDTPFYADSLVGTYSKYVERLSCGGIKDRCLIF